MGQSKRDQDERRKLQAEKCALIDTVKKLNRDVSKLEGWKRHILQSLQEEEQVKQVSHHCGHGIPTLLSCDNHRGWDPKSAGGTLHGIIGSSWEFSHPSSLLTGS